MTLAVPAIAGAFALDVLLGEPPDVAHPVAWFGGLLQRSDRHWERPTLAGVALALVLPVVAAVAVGTGVTLAGTGNPWLGVALGAVVLFVSTSYRSLLLTVRRVAVLAGSDLEAARRELRALAGRDADHLEAGQIRSAALESLAENLSDGLVAPLLGFGLAAGVASVLGLGAPATLGLACAGAVWVKAVNTMDSMWGYPDRDLGTGAARLDDVVMWLPARVTALLLAIVFLTPGALPRCVRWLEDVASPNAGCPMGALAAGLDVRFEKPGHYVLNPDEELPAPADVSSGLRRVAVAGLLVYGLAGVLAWS